MDEFLLMQSPLQPVVILSLYLFFVLKLGPNLMKNRQPFSLKKIIIIYNVSQIVLCAFIVFKSVQIALQTTIGCTPVDESHLKVLPDVLNLTHSYMLLKIYDLSETIFFVLRKKKRQISFLHLFHHVGTYLFVWVLIKYFHPSEVFPPRSAIILCGLNSFVHVFMYIYYLLSSLDVAFGVWWKKSITLLQLAQHFTFFFLGLDEFLDHECPYPKSVVFWGMSFAFSQIYLFGNFYYNNYFVKQKR